MISFNDECFLAHFRTAAATKIGKKLEIFFFFLLQNRNNAPK
jgi:hypothetical protein